MPSTIPEGLAPEVYPLAWLLGTWRGPGFLAYPGIPEQPFVQEIAFTSDGGPYLAYTSTTWLLDAVPAPGATEVAGDAEEVRYVPGRVWAAESGFWRVAPPEAGGAARGAGGAVPAGAPAEVEVLLAEPTGHVSVYLGTARGARIEIATDLVARTSTAADVAAAHRMYGLVEGELMWAMDMAAFGHDLQPYASARLARLAGPAT